MGLVGMGQYDAWRDPYIESIPKDVEAPEMFLVAFIKHFNIPKDKFIETTELLKRNLVRDKFDITYEDNEIPNADLLYTFNNEKINDYYSRDLKKATETDDWLQEWLETNKPYKTVAGTHGF